MTDRELIEMAREAGHPFPPADFDFLARFAALVADKAAAAERDACAQIVEAPHWKAAVRQALTKRAAEIRARGEK